MPAERHRQPLLFIDFECMPEADGSRDSSGWHAPPPSLGRLILTGLASSTVEFAARTMPTIVRTLTSSRFHSKATQPSELGDRVKTAQSRIVEATESVASMFESADQLVSASVARYSPSSSYAQHPPTMTTPSPRKNVCFSDFEAQPRCHAPRRCQCHCSRRARGGQFMANTWPVMSMFCAMPSMFMTSMRPYKTLIDVMTGKTTLGRTLQR
ncbi:uncharacterized protein SCHCODRAFT_02207257 [Schizophyllum commune H4-8]|uniref:uncharacterized protein n=1 Tax=Schizophyllum commune (strain H4-8 / FGSC 9210) TaxID=578458 RepID=UPI00215FDE92|nr:uncharacterized protein SCHCODRAFT_02207257 [Schizophyllum commune H4-8]KAI5897131.1 hypothetical protein SCHCODRAFT_02207257 [Schizophyllum commune H4-8]